MSKNFLGGAVINSGPDLPAVVPEGTLFMKSGSASGLYFFGLNPDADPLTLGTQAALQWSVLVDTSGASPFVLKTGDTMTGNLVMGSGAVRAGQGVPNATNNSTNGYGFGDDGDTGMFSTGVGGLGTDLRFYLNDVERLNISAGNVTIAGNTVWHAGNDGVGSGLDADLLDGQHGSYFLDVGNMTAGILPIARGGTNTSAVPSAGAIIYGNGSQYAVSAVGSAPTGSGTGTNRQVIVSNGAGAPFWHDSLDLNVAYAVDAGSAVSATTANTALALTTVSTANVNPFNVGTSARAAASGATGIPIVANMTVWNHQYDTTAGSQIAIPASASGANQRMFFRGGAASAWAAWTEVITTANIGSFGSGSFVLKAGDTMTGGLTIDAANGLAVGSVSLPGAGSINMTGSLSASGNIITNGGNVVANAGGIMRVGSSGAGYFRGGSASSGGSMSSPMFSFEPWTGTGGASNGMYMPGANNLRLVVAGSDIVSFTAGNSSFTGNIVASGNITAFSDRRLKENIGLIENAVAKVSAINGVTYTRVGQQRRETGVIAQDVLAVMPEAVREHEGYLSVAYGNMVGLLVEAIKEQQSEIDLLKKQVSYLITRTA